MAQCARLDTHLASCSPAWDRFSAAIDDVLQRFIPIHPDELWPVVGISGLHIGDVNAGDFAYKLANISWTLVQANFGGVNGGVGAVLSHFKGDDWQKPKNWTSASEEIDSGAFLRYMDLPGGMHYLILHETAHTTYLGLQTNNQQFDNYVQSGGDRDDGAAWAASAQWYYNEQVANAIAKTVAREIGLDILDKPTCGFPDGPGPMARRIVNV